MQYPSVDSAPECNSFSTNLYSSYFGTVAEASEPYNPYFVETLMNPLATAKDGRCGDVFKNVYTALPPDVTGLAPWLPPYVLQNAVESQLTAIEELVPRYLATDCLTAQRVMLCSVLFMSPEVVMQDFNLGSILFGNSEPVLPSFPHHDVCVNYYDKCPLLISSAPSMAFNCSERLSLDPTVSPIQMFPSSTQVLSVIPLGNGVTYPVVTSPHYPTLFISNVNEYYSQKHNASLVTTQVQTFDAVQCPPGLTAWDFDHDDERFGVYLTGTGCAISCPSPIYTPQEYRYLSSEYLIMTLITLVLTFIQCINIFVMKHNKRNLFFSVAVGSSFLLLSVLVAQYLRAWVMNEGDVYLTAEQLTCTSETQWQSIRNPASQNSADGAWCVGSSAVSLIIGNLAQWILFGCSMEIWLRVVAGVRQIESYRKYYLYLTLALSLSHSLFILLTMFVVSYPNEHGKETYGDVMAPGSVALTCAATVSPGDKNLQFYVITIPQMVNMMISFLLLMHALERCFRITLRARGPDNMKKTMNKIWKSYGMLLMFLALQVSLFPILTFYYNLNMSYINADRYLSSAVNWFGCLLANFTNSASSASALAVCGNVPSDRPTPEEMVAPQAVEHYATAIVLCLITFSNKEVKDFWGFWILKCFPCSDDVRRLRNRFRARWNKLPLDTYDTPEDRLRDNPHRAFLETRIGKDVTDEAYEQFLHQHKKRFSISYSIASSVSSAVSSLFFAPVQSAILTKDSSSKKEKKSRRHSRRESFKTPRTSDEANAWFRSMLKKLKRHDAETKSVKESASDIEQGKYAAAPVVVPLSAASLASASSESSESRELNSSSSSSSLSSHSSSSAGSSLSASSSTWMRRRQSRSRHYGLSPAPSAASSTTSKGYLPTNSTTTSAQSATGTSSWENVFLCLRILCGLDTSDFDLKVPPSVPNSPLSTPTHRPPPNHRLSKVTVPLAKKKVKRTVKQVKILPSVATQQPLPIIEMEQEQLKLGVNAIDVELGTHRSDDAEADNADAPIQEMKGKNNTLLWWMINSCSLATWTSIPRFLLEFFTSAIKGPKSAKGDTTAAKKLDSKPENNTAGESWTSEVDRRRRNSNSAHHQSHKARDSYRLHWQRLRASPGALANGIIIDARNKANDKYGDQLADEPLPSTDSAADVAFLPLSKPLPGHSAEPNDDHNDDSIYQRSKDEMDGNDAHGSKKQRSRVCFSESPYGETETCHNAEKVLPFASQVVGRLTQNVRVYADSSGGFEGTSSSSGKSSHTSRKISLENVLQNVEEGDENDEEEKKDDSHSIDFLSEKDEREAVEARLNSKLYCNVPPNTRASMTLTQFTDPVVSLMTLRTTLSIGNLTNQHSSFNNANDEED
jgi:hypothetical protein